MSFDGMEVCDWCDEITYVEQFHAIGGGADPVSICGMCFPKVGHLYEKY